MRWWLLAPALAVALGLAWAVTLRTQWVTLDELREQHAGEPMHRTPWFLWERAGPGGVVVATEPGGAALPGEWRRDGRFLVGSLALGDAADREHAVAVWRGVNVDGTVSAGDLEWHRRARGACPADLDELGQDTALVGRWRVSTSPDSWVDLRADGTVVDANGDDRGRWAGRGGVIVTFRAAGWRDLPLDVHVRDEGWAEQFDAALLYASTDECEIHVLFRPRE